MNKSTISTFVQLSIHSFHKHPPSTTLYIVVDTQMWQRRRRSLLIVQIHLDSSILSCVGAVIWWWISRDKIITFRIVHLTNDILFILDYYFDCGRERLKNGFNWNPSIGGQCVDDCGGVLFVILVLVHPWREVWWTKLNAYTGYCSHVCNKSPGQMILEWSSAGRSL